MAPNPQCAALAAAKARTGLSYADIAAKIGSTEQRVTEICTGTTRPSAEEFQKLATALDIKDPIPSDSAHTA
ncbi:hypothetical protein CC1G_07276 [Coprinopsis cinerea okayama7|uniref:HTH cro/C1-type domain-containing protein n=1 Tax=Coprinopsis cinerea (strain Okayama-7 / 130 / ATCC MYA-4618 / FGSC 9003) TaxID=240176 RepID=A8NNH5_COPC7|nr:hypothetical protein CC1G_07276 [Coprinopsis cinerea okayama7\|eukprot:XP_001835134.1 hypothetical protein CC1G_07276 [Coprinopsis cinerea okayama7\